MGIPRVNGFTTHTYNSQILAEAILQTHCVVVDYRRRQRYSTLSQAIHSPGWALVGQAGV